MKHRLVSLAIAGMMLLSVGGAVSAAPTNPKAEKASCHGQTVSILASNGNPPGRNGVISVKEWQNNIREACAYFAPD